MALSEVEGPDEGPSEAMTPDGIRTEDWDEIEALARDVADATLCANGISYEKAVAQLLRKLTVLQNRYGPLPSILATRAEYLADDQQAIDLLKEAYRVAESRKDAANMTYIASAIAQRYVEDLADVQEGRLWTDQLRSCLYTFPDEGEFEILKNLESRIRIRAVPKTD